MSYRDDHEALAQYHDDLARELAQLEAKAADLARIQAERDRVARELTRVRADLAHRAARRAPVRLDSLRVAAPCDVPWESMKGDDRTRDCAKCEKTVYNISNMTRDEAEEFLAARGTSACVRFYRRKDGTVMTSDCPAGVKRRRRKLAIASAVLAAGGTAAGYAIAQDAEDSATMGVILSAPPEDVEVLQGGITFEKHQAMSNAIPALGNRVGR